MTNKRLEELHTIRKIMTDKDGRAFIMRCLQHCGTYDSLFVKDPFNHAYNSGLREVGVWLEGEIKEAANESFLMMLRENQDG